MNPCSLLFPSCCSRAAIIGRPHKFKLDCQTPSSFLSLSLSPNKKGNHKWYKGLILFVMRKNWELCQPFLPHSYEALKSLSSGLLMSVKHSAVDLLFPFAFLIHVCQMLFKNFCGLKPVLCTLPRDPLPHFLVIDINAVSACAQVDVCLTHTYVRLT